jgi:4a-hydroxytetrahydrobiopterin dehydratase
MKLSDEQIRGKLTRAEGWQLEETKWIVKKYRFREYLEAIRFVERVAQAAERLNHHPFIAIDYKLVTLRLTSWHAGGLTELDFTAAEEFDLTFDPGKP